MRQLVHPIKIFDGSSSFVVPPRSKPNIEDRYDGIGVENLGAFSVAFKAVNLLFLISIDASSPFEYTTKKTCREKVIIKIHHIIIEF
jgi:hypothetical protein